MDRVLKSENSNQIAYVRFLNLTPRRVEIIWLNHDGIGVPYKELGHREHIDINTYLRHYWIVCDCQTRDRMVFLSGRSGLPETVFTPNQPEGQEAADRNRMNKRKWVLIALPVLSLKEICFQKLRSMELNTNKFKKVHLPSFLKDEYDEFLSDPNILRSETERRRSFS